MEIDWNALEANLGLPMWRLRNLYACRTEGKGGAEPFVPRQEQELIFQHLLDHPEVPAYIIKSRRLGLSTGICTFQADAAIFRSGWRGILIDQNQRDATKKMVEIIRFAVDNLDPAILETVRFDKRNDSELRLRVSDEKEAQDSVIYATTSGRGGDCSMLHVSEWGPIAAEDAPRSAEIRTGAFPAARLGRRVVETTWMGGKGGDLWDLIEPIMTSNPNAEGKIFFFPWHDDPVAFKTDGMVTAEVEEYFRELQGRLGKRFSQEQKKWWASKKLEQGIFMSREYPSTLDESFRAPVEGSIYGKFMDAAQAEGRVKPFPWDRSHLVHTFWDLGSPKNTRTIYVQFVGREIHVIDHDTGLEYGPTERVAHIKGKGYPYGGHFLPHDAAATEKSGKNFQEQLEDAGLVGIEIVPRCAEVWTGINKVGELMPRMWWHAEKCAGLLASVAAYHTKKGSKDGHATNNPEHDWSSHDADAVRQIAEAMEAGLIRDGTQARTRVISPIDGLGDAETWHGLVVNPIDY